MQETLGVRSLSQEIPLKNCQLILLPEKYGQRICEHVSQKNFTLSFFTLFYFYNAVLILSDDRSTSDMLGLACDFAFIALFSRMNYWEWAIELSAKLTFELWYVEDFLG